MTSIPPPCAQFAYFGDHCLQGLGSVYGQANTRIGVCPFSSLNSTRAVNARTKGKLCQGRSTAVKITVG